MFPNPTKPTAVMPTLVPRGVPAALFGGGAKRRSRRTSWGASPTRRSRRGSRAEGLSAVDRDDLAGHPCGLLRQQEQARPDHVVRLAHPLDREPLDQLLGRVA